MGTASSIATTGFLQLVRLNRVTYCRHLNALLLTSYLGAAASLKYANPQDLPSYPSSGLKKNTSAAGTAATIGWDNQKSFEHWKPDPSAPAAAAALAAKDYKMKPLWQPEQSSNGAKAAILAHKNDGKVEIWRPEATSAGSTAATQAFKKFGAGQSSPQIDYGYTAVGRQGSLLAATGAMSTSRKRAGSTPQPPPKLETYPDAANAVSNALKAATSAHKTKRQNDSHPEGGSVPFTNMSREMYTSHPPVAPEVNEMNRQNSLHASAVAMAQQMYKVQHKQAETAKNSQSHSGAIAAHGRQASTSSSADEVPGMRFNNLQEAAQKLAHERLAKLHDEHAQNREYRDYYGSSNKPASRLSIRGRTRRRASSDGGLDEDREQSNKIRAQMSLFSNNVSQVDEKKRKQDRENLIAVAQRNVTNRLHGMDEKVFADTGKVAPSLLNEWEQKAHAAAQAKSDNRMENHGKIHIGGGKFINQSAVDLVASKNVQPVLDDINEKAEAKRLREAELRADEEKARVDAAKIKEREKEEKDVNKKLKRKCYLYSVVLYQLLIMKLEHDKEEERVRKAEEKATKEEEKRLAKERRQSQKAEAVVVKDSTAETNTAAAAESVETPVEHEATPATVTTTEPRQPSPAPVTGRPAVVRTSMEDQASLRMRENADTANPDESTPLSPASPTKDGGKVKSWLKNRFSRRSSKAQKPTDYPEKKEPEKSSGFIGGAALTGASVGNASNASLGANSSSVRDVALASSASKAKSLESLGQERELEPLERADTASTVSSLSTVSRTEDVDAGEEEEEFQEARDNFDEDLAPPPTFPAQKSSSPARSTKFVEEI
jgi:hypothetical protein